MLMRIIKCDDVADIKVELPSFAELIFVVVLGASCTVVILLVQKVYEVLFCISEFCVGELYKQCKTSLLLCAA